MWSRNGASRNRTQKRRWKEEEGEIKTVSKLWGSGVEKSLGSQKNRFHAGKKRNSHFCQVGKTEKHGRRGRGTIGSSSPLRNAERIRRLLVWRKRAGKNEDPAGKAKRRKKN